MTPKSNFAFLFILSEIFGIFHCKSVNYDMNLKPAYYSQIISYLRFLCREIDKSSLHWFQCFCIINFFQIDISNFKFSRQVRVIGVNLSVQSRFKHSNEKLFSGRPMVAYLVSHVISPHILWYNVNASSVKGGGGHTNQPFWNLLPLIEN